MNVTRNVTYNLDILGRNVILTFSQDGETLAGNGEDLTVWNTSTGQILSEIETERLSVNQRPIVSPDGHYVALVEDHQLKIWDTSTGQIVSELTSTPVNAIAFHPTLDIVVIADRYNISVNNIQTGKRIHTLSPSGFIVPYDDTLHFSHTDDYLIFGSGTGAIRIWNWESGSIVTTLETHHAGGNNIALSKDESIMLTSDIDGNLLVWDYGNLELLESIPTRSIRIEKVILSTDNKMVFVLSADGVISLWGVPSSEKR